MQDEVRGQARVRIKDKLDEACTNADDRMMLVRHRSGHQEITRVILCRLILNDIIIHIKFLNDIIMFSKIVWHFYVTNFENCVVYFLIRHNDINCYLYVIVFLNRIIILQCVMILCHSINSTKWHISSSLNGPTTTPLTTRGLRPGGSVVWAGAKFVRTHRWGMSRGRTSRPGAIPDL